MQGMTIRTARLPGAGHHQLFLLTESYFNSSTRFWVTVAVFVLRFHNRNISFLLHHQTDRLQCRSMWLACHCSYANQKLALFTRGEAWLALSFGVSFLKGASEDGGGGGWVKNKNKFEKLKANRSQSKERSLFPRADERICLGCLQWWHGPQLCQS